MTRAEAASQWKKYARTPQAALSWCIVVGALLLPAMSHIGYPPQSIEYLASFLLCVGLGLVVSRLALWRYACAAMLLVCIGCCVTIYFGDMLSASDRVLMMTWCVFIAYIILALLHTKEAMKLAVIFSAAQIIAGVATTTPMEYDLSQPPGVHSRQPPVVHLLFDEHGGTGTFASGGIPPEEVKAFEDEYVRHGFIVFRRLYTTYGFTHLSLTYLMNYDAFDAANLVDENNQMRSSTVLDKIGENRALDITHTRYVDLSDSLRDNKSVSRQVTYDESIVYPAYEKYRLPVSERLVVAASKLANWLYSAVHFPPVMALVNYTRTGRKLYFSAEPYFRTSPLSSRFVLEQFIDRLSCCGQSGTYYFIHLLLPHYPYAFDDHCALLPAADWKLRVINTGTSTNTLQSRRERYRLHFNEARCVAQDMFSLTDGVQKNKDMEKAVIFMHSDHGSRIAIEDLSSVSPQQYSWADHERDWRGGFAAIRIPGVPGRVIDKPVKLASLYRMLVENNFTEIDESKLESVAESPY